MRSGHRHLATIATIAFLIVTALATRAPAQPSQSRFEDLPVRMKAGDRVRVTGTDVGVMDGRVTDVNPTSFTLAIREDGPTALRTIVFRHTDVRQITRIDSPWNGALIGFAAGAIPGSILAQASCGEGPSGACSRNGTIGAMIFGGLGLAIGAAVDESIKKTIFKSSRIGSVVAITPLVGRGVQGLNLSLRF